MPVAPYGTEKYRHWNAERMRRRRREGVLWDKHYEESDQGQFMRSTYEGSSRRLILRANHDHGALGDRLGVGVEDLEPRQTVADINRWRELVRTIERAGGWDAYRAQLKA